jgi:hypothetical protein
VESSADPFRSFEVEDQLELRRLLDGEISGLGTLENLVDVESDTRERIDKIRTVVHQSAGVGKSVPPAFLVRNLESQKTKAPTGEKPVGPEGVFAGTTARAESAGSGSNVIYCLAAGVTIWIYRRLLYDHLRNWFAGCPVVLRADAS